jgi:hypothetical protein
MVASAQRPPLSFQCKPPGFVSEETAQRIADDLSRGFSKGKVGEDGLFRLHQPGDAATLHTVLFSSRGSPGRLAAAAGAFSFPGACVVLTAAHATMQLVSNA